MSAADFVHLPSKNAFIDEIMQLKGSMPYIHCQDLSITTLEKMTFDELLTRVNILRKEQHETTNLHKRILLMYQTLQLPSSLQDVESLTVQQLEEYLSRLQMKHKSIEAIRAIQLNRMARVDDMAHLSKLTLPDLIGKEVTLKALEEKDRMQKKALIAEIELLQVELGLPKESSDTCYSCPEAVLERSFDYLQELLRGLQSKQGLLIDALKQDITSLQTKLDLHTCDPEGLGKAVHGFTAEQLKKHLDDLMGESEKRRSVAAEVIALRLQLGLLHVPMDHWIGYPTRAIDTEREALLKQIGFPPKQIGFPPKQIGFPPKQGATTTVEVVSFPDSVPEDNLSSEEIHDYASKNIQRLIDAGDGVQAMLTGADGIHVKLQALQKKWKETPWCRDSESAQEKLKLVLKDLGILYHTLSILREDVHVAKTTNIAELIDRVRRPRVRYQVMEVGGADGVPHLHGCHSFKDLAEQDAFKRLMKGQNVRVVEVPIV